MRSAPRNRLRSGGAAVRAGQGLRHAPGAVRHRPLYRQPDQYQAEGHRHRPLQRRPVHGRRGHRGDRAQRPRRRRLQEAGPPRRQAGRRRDVRRHGRRQLVFQAAARRPQGGRYPRPPDVRRVQYRRCRPPGPEQGAGHGRQRRGLRLQRRHQGGHLQGHQGARPVHAGRGAQAHQGQRELRFLHRSGGAVADVHRRRRLQRFAEDEGPVRLHRAWAPGRARRHPRTPPAHR